MYTSVIYNSIVTDLKKSSDESTSRFIRSFYLKMIVVVKRTGTAPILLNGVFREIHLPSNTTVNVSLGIYATQMLFVAGMEDISRNPGPHTSVTEEDIQTAKAFLSQFRDRIRDMNSSTSDSRMQTYYRRDIAPILGNVLTSQLLFRA